MKEIVLNPERAAGAHARELIKAGVSMALNSPEMLALVHAYVDGADLAGEWRIHAEFEIKSVAIRQDETPEAEADKPAVAPQTVRARRSRR